MRRVANEASIIIYNNIDKNIKSIDRNCFVFSFFIEMKTISLTCFFTTHIIGQTNSSYDYFNMLKYIFILFLFKITN